MEKTVDKAVQAAPEDTTHSRNMARLWAMIKFTTPEYQKAEEECAFTTYACWPALARRYIGKLMSLMSESFCERILSVANQVMTKANTSTDAEEIGVLAMLRTNTQYIQEQDRAGQTEEMMKFYQQAQVEDVGEESDDEAGSNVSSAQAGERSKRKERSDE
mmetsp:Transcript_117989/g.165883  ORF Transcript_117989/g.165883 Transcript_117989/m.165883 type:complete len:161 (-) Transcript_117989:67-549(-)